MRYREGAAPGELGAPVTDYLSAGTAAYGLVPGVGFVIAGWRLRQRWMIVSGVGLSLASAGYPGGVRLGSLVIAYGAPPTRGLANDDHGPGHQCRWKGCWKGCSGKAGVFSLSREDPASPMISSARFAKSTGSWASTLSYSATSQHSMRLA